MTTQRHGVKNVLASIVVGMAIVIVGGLGLRALDGGLPTEPFGDTADAGQGAQDPTHEVIDSAGRTVNVPDDPQHIAAMDSFSGDVCVLIGAGEKLMGAPGGVISNELLGAIYPDLDRVDRLSGNDVNVETLLSAGVDVALVKRDLYEDGGETAKLDKLGIPYVVVDYGTVEEQMEAIGLVGQVCGSTASEKADDIVDYYRKTVEAVEERASTIPDDQRKRVYHSINDPLLTDGADSLGADWIARTGGIDVSAQERGTGGTGDYTATLEQVYTWAPDTIVCSTRDARDEIDGDVQWQGLAAVSSGDVYNLPVSTSRWGQRGDPETFLGMLWLGKTLYPERYEDVDLKDTVVSYYRDVIGLDIDDATWNVIVAGEGLRDDGSGGGGDR